MNEIQLTVLSDFRFLIACWTVTWNHIRPSSKMLQAAPTTSTTWHVRYSKTYWLSSKLPVRKTFKLYIQTTNNTFCALQEPEDQEYFSQFVTLPVVRRAIHVGNLTFNNGSEVEKHLLEDVMKSIKPWLGVLMDNYRVRGVGLSTAATYNGTLVHCVCCDMTIA